MTQLSQQHPPVEVQLRTLAIIASYLLYDRREDTELSLAFATLVQERHNHFHGDVWRDNKGNPSSFTECRNEKCQAANRILSARRDMHIPITTFAAQLMDQQYTLEITPATGTLLVRLKKNDEPSDRLAHPSPPPAGKIILES